MATKKKVTKKPVEKKPVATKTFHRMERINGGFAIITITVDETGTVIKSEQSVEDVFGNAMHVLKRMIKDDHGL